MHDLMKPMGDRWVQYLRTLGEFLEDIYCDDC